MVYRRNHCKRVYHFTESKPVFQPKRKFSFARLLRSLRSDWKDVECKSNIFWVLDFKSFVTHCWIKKISVSHFSPASRPLRSPTSLPSLSRLPYPSRPLFSRAPAPLSPPPQHKDLYGINKVLLLQNEHGDPLFLFPNLRSYNINSRLAKFEKNLSVGSTSEE